MQHILGPSYLELISLGFSAGFLLAPSLPLALLMGTSCKQIGAS